KEIVVNKFLCSVVGIALVALGGDLAAARADTHHHGPNLVNHPSTMGNGHHHIHTTPSGHKVLAHVQAGKIRGLHVRDRNGRPVAGVDVGAAAVGGEGETAVPALDSSETLQAGGVLIGFGFFDAVDGVWIWVWFPAAWVVIV